MNKYVRLTHVKRLWSQIPCSNDWVYFLRVDLFLRSQILQINRICKYVTTTTYQIWCIALTSSSRVTQSNSSGYFLKIHIKRWKFVWSTSRMFFSLLYMHFCLFIKILHCRTCLSKCIILSRFNKHYLFFLLLSVQRSKTLQQYRCIRAMGLLFIANRKLYLG